MDVTEIMGSVNVTLDVVKSSPSKKLVILSGGTIKEYDGRRKLYLTVEMDGRNLGWIPNKTTLRNLAEKFGTESSSWIGKPISLEMGIVNGRQAVIGTPLNLQS